MEREDETTAPKNGGAFEKTGDGRGGFALSGRDHARLAAALEAGAPQRAADYFSESTEWERPRGATTTLGDDGDSS